jgi:hypothetical protein
MAGKSCAEVNSVLPMNARTSRIASGGGIVAIAHDFPAGGVAPLDPSALPNDDPTKPFTITEPSYEGEKHEQSTDDWT